MTITSDGSHTDQMIAKPQKTGFAWQRWLPLGVLVAALVAFFAFDLDRYFSFEMLQDHRQWLTEFVAANAVLASVGFFLAYALAIAISIPVGLILSLAAGFMFGVVWASILVVLAATTGASVAFLAARTALRGVIERRAGGWIKRLESGFRDSAFSYLLTLRLIPIVPFWLVNLVPALLGVRLTTFAIATLIGIIPGTVVFVSVGNGLGATLDRGETPNLGIIFDPAILLPLIGLAVLSLLPALYKKYSQHRR
ncbi:MAG: TVP38/TMEM64 family protein [Pseudomonadota bacterium]